MTYRDIWLFINTAQSWLEKHPAESKFRYALRKVLKQAEKSWGAYTEMVEDLDIEHCSVDDKGIIIKDSRGVVEFTKDNIRKRNAARKSLFESNVKDVEPFMAKVVPPDLTQIERDAFAGFVLPIPTDEEPAD